ncbi:MAG: flagellin [Dehalococcoidia bacterium]|nr:flagellin [Dehalococcoidia bacterium]
MIINANVMAINAQRNLSSTNIKLGRALEKLSSGLRVNRAADDAAGLTISEKMRSQIRGMRHGSRNAQDGISMIQTAEGATSEVHALLQRMRELSVQPGNSTLSTQDRTAICTEIQALKTDVDNIANRVTFNGLSLLTGTLAVSSPTALGPYTATGDTFTMGVDVSKAQPGTTYTIAGAGANVTITNTTMNVAQTVAATAFIALNELKVLDFNALGIKLNLTQTVFASGYTAAEIATALNGAGQIVTNAGNGNAVYRVGADVGQDITVTFTDIRTTNLGGANKISTMVTDDQNVSTIAKANTPSMVWASSSCATVVGSSTRVTAHSMSPRRASW